MSVRVCVCVSECVSVNEEEGEGKRGSSEKETGRKGEVEGKKKEG